MCVCVCWLNLQIAGTTVQLNDYSSVSGWQSPLRVCVCVCEQERMILSVTFQDLFLPELLGTGHFLADTEMQVCGSGFLTLEKL